MHELINFRDDEYLKIKWDEFEHFTFPWHFHDEYEIIYVIESYGKKFVGDRIEKFEKGDLVLIGSKLPHFWKNDQVFYKNEPGRIVKAVVIHFPNDFMNKEINEFNDLSNIKRLLSAASRGIIIEPPDNISIGEKMMRLLKVRGIDRFLLFLSILNEMAVSKNLRFLATMGYENSLSNINMHNSDWGKPFNL